MEERIEVKDAVLHAVKEEYVEAVEYLLDWEEKHHVIGQPYVSICNQDDWLLIINVLYNLEQPYLLNI